jgi:signal transduction histidine kinase
VRDETTLAIRPDSATMVRALGLLYIGGPSVAVVSLILPHSRATDVTGTWVLIVLAYAMVPVLFTQYQRLPPLAVSGVIAFANCLVSLVIFFNHDASSAYSFLYLWVTPFAMVFFSTRHALAHVGFAAVAYAIVLAVLVHDGQAAPGSAQAARWMHTIAALLVIALLVRALDRSLRENLVRIEEERRRRALEINDDIVQRLVLARQCHASGEDDACDAEVDAALMRARTIMAELIAHAPVAPGSLRRETAATIQEP